MFPDYHFISGFGSVYIQFTQKLELLLSEEVDKMKLYS